MPKLSVVAGSTSQSVNVFVRDSTSTTGAGLAAVAPAGGSLLTGTKLYYSFSGANGSAGVAVSLAVLAAVNSAWSSAGIVTLDGTNLVGWVRLDIPNAALAASKGRSVSFLLFGGTNMAPTPFEIELTGWDNQDGVHGGMTALPNAAAEAAGGLYTRGTGAGQINQAHNGQIDARDVQASVFKNQALATFSFTMVQSADHVTPATGKTVTVQISKDGGAFANATNSPATEIASGYYQITLTATEMNATNIAVKATASGCDQRNFSILPELS